jgi:hypothetical protein
MLKINGFFLGPLDESVTFTFKIMGILFSIFEFSPYRQFSWNKLHFVN